MIEAAQRPNNCLIAFVSNLSKTVPHPLYAYISRCERGTCEIVLWPASPFGMRHAAKRYSMRLDHVILNPKKLDGVVAVSVDEFRGLVAT
jgi:hypothetical protein